MPADQSHNRQLFCFSHLRWGFVYQRPQHLLSRFAARLPVWFVEEPLPTEGSQASLDLTSTDCGVTVATPRIPAGWTREETDAAQRELVNALLTDNCSADPILWYYTPMARGFSEHLRAGALIYDCMDELSLFRGAPTELLERERALLRAADLVFTGGRSLYEAKRLLHPRVHAFPSSVDAAHFAQARQAQGDPEDQAGIPRPRLGFAGVIDERMDFGLVEAVARARPDWQFVMLGPVVKVDPAELPEARNLHWLGGKDYKDLPRYMAGWDVALMPFALNDSTRFISPTKTPEYLAAGLPVVSTPIRDVVSDYKDVARVRIADDAAGFVAAVEAALSEGDTSGLAEADARLSTTSWDATAAEMMALVDGVLREAAKREPVRENAFAAARLRRAKTEANGFDYLIVGAGFAGSVLAERLAADSDKRVLLIDRRGHVGGNAYDCYDDAGILIHRYGPHIFHTNSVQVAAYLSRFTRWRPYEHRVRAKVGDALLPIPINLDTINGLYGLDLDSDGMERFLAERAEPVREVRTSEDVVVGRVGRELYETFFRGYTRKQWGMDPSELDKSVTARVPTRTDRDDRYFTDSFQYMPLHGFTRMFENMLDHPNIKILLNADFREIRREVSYEKLIFTGPIDEYFDYRYGELPYRSLSFRHETLDAEQLQPVAVVNYPQENVGFTRITEYKHLTGQRHAKTSISYEFPSWRGDPYYPVPRAENAKLYKKYQALADATRNVEFVGRLATYKYYNMDQVVAQALALYARIAGAKRIAGAAAREEAANVGA